MTTEERDPELEELLAFIRDERGFDFTGYKRASLGRRITSACRKTKAASYAEYRDLLETDPAEYALLFDTILINVTSFFRDPLAWEYVREEIAAAHPHATHRQRLDPDLEHRLLDRRGGVHRRDDLRGRDGRRGVPEPRQDLRDGCR